MAMTKLSQTAHNGFLVVRLPQFNFDAQGRGAFRSEPPKLGKIYYGGVFRMPWFDLDEDYYGGKLPTALASTRQKIKELNRDFSGIDVCDNYEDAGAILEYSNRQSSRNEIIVVRSEKIKEIKGNTLYVDGEIEWLGVDLVALGAWSLLENGLFPSPSYFSRWTRNLNSNGLLIESTDFGGVVQDYLVAASKGGAEEFPSQLYGMDPVEIGRVR